jgi:hypothetical protein
LPGLGLLVERRVCYYFVLLQVLSVEVLVVGVLQTQVVLEQLLDPAPVVLQRLLLPSLHAANQSAHLYAKLVLFELLPLLRLEVFD